MGLRRISLLPPGRFRSDPHSPYRRRVRGGVIEIIRVRVYAFAAMSAMVVVLHCDGVEVMTAAGVVAALGAAASQITTVGTPARRTAAVVAP